MVLVTEKNKKLSHESFIMITRAEPTKMCVAFFLGIEVCNENYWFFWFFFYHLKYCQFVQQIK